MAAETGLMLVLIMTLVSDLYQSVWLSATPHRKYGEAEMKTPIVEQKQLS